MVPSAKGTPCNTFNTVSPGLPHLGRADSGFRITLSLALVTENIHKFIAVVLPSHENTTVPVLSKHLRDN